MTDENPTHLDLFSGIGGFALAAYWAGFRTVGFCEIEPYCQKVLKKNFGAIADPASQRLGEAGQRGQRSTQRFDGFLPALHSDIRTLDGTRYRGVDLLTAGVPCQPSSCAGLQLGPKDDRWLWPDALRIIGEAKPTFAVFENPLGLLALEDGLVFEALLSAMEGHGYEVCPPIIIPACGVQADYYRYRVFVVANLAQHGLGQGLENGARGPGRVGTQEHWSGSGDGSEHDAQPQSERCGRVSGASERQEQRQQTQDGLAKSIEGFCWPETHFELLRGIPGVPARLDRNRRARIHALGNSVVPAQVYPILKAIRNLIWT